MAGEEEKKKPKPPCEDPALGTDNKRISQEGPARIWECRKDLISAKKIKIKIIKSGLGRSEVGVKRREFWSDVTEKQQPRKKGQEQKKNVIYYRAAASVKPPALKNIALGFISAGFVLFGSAG